MSCEITRGRDLPCKDGAAGLLAVYLMNRPFKVTFDGTRVSNIEAGENGGTPIRLHRYELDNTGNTFNENLNASRDAGTFYNEQVITLALQTLQDDDLEEVQNLAKGRPAMLVQYRNGKVRLAGISRGIDFSGGNQSGGDLGDFQGYNLTGTAKENSYAPLLKGATIDAPFGGLDTEPIIVTGADESGSGSGSGS